MSHHKMVATIHDTRAPVNIENFDETLLRVASFRLMENLLASEFARAN